jgi:uncharacterized protein
MTQRQKNLNHRMINRRHALMVSAGAIVNLGLSPRYAEAWQAPVNWRSRLISAAREQIGQTTQYVPAYVRIGYPGGDVPRETGVCTDVLIRAYRDALGVDLQKLVHEDMRRSFAAYPRKWGLSRPDTNIDHRRVPNLQTFFVRRGLSLPKMSPNDFEPGDIVTQMLPGNLPHIGIVSSSRKRGDAPHDVIHNIGRGTQEEDILTRFPITGRYRYVVTIRSS